jgi:hypothetical protein
MNVRLLPLVLVALAMPACFYEHHTLGPSDGLNYDGTASITFSWSFGGRSCAQAGISSVVVSIPGQWVQNDGNFSCTTSNYDGITLTSFLPGSYSYTVSGYDVTGALRYQGSGTVYVDGLDQFETVNLTSAIGTPTEVPDAGVGGTFDAGTIGWPDAGIGGGYDAGTHGGYDAGTGGTGGTGGCGCHLDGGMMDAGVSYHHDVSWTLQDVPNAPTCGDELAAVVLTVDGDPVAHECGSGLYPSRITLPSLTAGQHSLEIDAVDANGRTWASNQVTIDIPAESSTYNIYPLTWVVGSAAVDWTFYSCDGVQTYPSCAAAQVETLGVNFEDCNGNWLWSDAHNYPLDQSISCSDANGSTVIRAVTPGCYTTFLAGYGTRASGIAYDENPGQSAYPLTVRAGVFLTPTSPTSSFVSVDLWQRAQ